MVYHTKLTHPPLAGSYPKSAACDGGDVLFICFQAAGVHAEQVQRVLMTASSTTYTPHTPLQANWLRHQTLVSDTMAAAADYVDGSLAESSRQLSRVGGGASGCCGCSCSAVSTKLGA
jgi:hypothetical protein